MNALDLFLGEPWAILPERLAPILEAAATWTLDPAKAISAREGRPMDGAKSVQIREGGVAVLSLHGVIGKRDNWVASWLGWPTVETVAKDFRAALDNSAVRSIVLDIDSPGGTAGGVAELAGMIGEGAKVKPVVCYVSDYGCSAAYWIASAGSEIVAAPSAILGSVGVIQVVRKSDGDKERVEFVSSQSPNKVPDVATEKGRSTIQAHVDSMASIFIAAVAENRGIEADKVVSDFGAGGVKIGQAAVDAGMADRVGSLESVISELSGGRADTSRYRVQPGAAAAARLNSQVQERKPMNFLAKLVGWFAVNKPEELEAAVAAAGVAGVEAGAKDAATGAGAAVAGSDAIASFLASLNANPAVKTAVASAEAAVTTAASTDASAIEAKAAADVKTALTAVFAGQGQAWAADLVKVGKLIPANAAGAVAAFVDAAILDATAALKFVAVDGTSAVVSRLEHVKAAFGGAPASTVKTTEQVPTDASKLQAFLSAGGFKVLPSAQTDPEDAAATASMKRLEAMLAGSETGKAVLADLKASAK